MPTKKKRKVCWKCKRKLTIDKTIKLVSSDYNIGTKSFITMKRDELYWCIPCLDRFKNFLCNSPLFQNQ